MMFLWLLGISKGGDSANSLVQPIAGLTQRAFPDIQGEPMFQLCPFSCDWWALLERPWLHLLCTLPSDIYTRS